MNKSDELLKWLHLHIALAVGKLPEYFDLKFEVKYESKNICPFWLKVSAVSRIFPERGQELTSFSMGEFQRCANWEIGLQCLINIVKADACGATQSRDDYTMEAS